MQSWEAENLAEAFGPWMIACAVIIGLAIIVAAMIRQKDGRTKR